MKKKAWLKITVIILMGLVIATMIILLPVIISDNLSMHDIIAIIKNDKSYFHKQPIDTELEYIKLKIGWIKSGKNPIKTNAEIPFKEKILSTLSFESKPEGASVQVNGVLKGETPLHIKIELGLHSIQISHPGFNDWNAQLDTKEQEEIPLFARLIPSD